MQQSVGFVAKTKRQFSVDNDRKKISIKRKFCLSSRCHKKVLVICGFRPLSISIHFEAKRANDQWDLVLRFLDIRPSKSLFFNVLCVLMPNI